MKNQLHRVFGIAFLWLILNNNAIAQESISLYNAISLGLESNYDIQIEEKNVVVSTMNNEWGEAGIMPTIDVGVRQNNTLQDNVKVANPFSPTGEATFQTVNPYVTLNWTLFRGLSAHINKKRLEYLQSETEGNAEIVIANTLQAIILGYYKAALEKQRLDEYTKQLRLSNDKYQYVKVKSEIGSVVSADLLLEEGNYLNDSTNFINQQLVFNNAMDDLAVLLGQNKLGSDYQLVDSLTFEPENYQLGDLQAQLESKNVDLKKQYLTQAILGQDLRLRKAERLPTLSMIANIDDNRQRIDFSNSTFIGTEPPEGAQDAITDTYFVNFNLSFRLFDGRKIHRAIKRAVLQQEIGQLRLESMKASLDTDLSKAFDTYNIRKQLYEINKRRHEVSQINLNLSQERFKNGTINSFDFRTVQNDNLSAAIQKLNALYQLIDANLSLMRLTGGITSTYK